MRPISTRSSLASLKRSSRSSAPRVRLRCIVAFWRTWPTPSFNVRPFSLTEEFAYFYWYTLVRSVYIKRILRATTAAPTLNVMTELVLGAVAAAFAQLFTTPVGVIATRQQIGGDHHEADNTFTGHIKVIYESDGITGFWRGLKPSLVLTVNPAITYGVFERTYILH